MLVRGLSITFRGDFRVGYFFWYLVPRFFVGVHYASLSFPTFQVRVVVRKGPVRGSVGFEGNIVVNYLWCLPYPIVVVRVYSTASLLSQFLQVVVTRVNLVSTMLVYVVLQPRVSPASPIFVSGAGVVGNPQLLVSVFFTRVYRQKRPIGYRVFGPFQRLLRNSTSGVSIGMDFASGLATGLGRLIHSRAIIFCRAAPVNVGRFLPILFQSSSIFPIVLIHGASPQPTRCQGLGLFGYFRRVYARPVSV